MLCSMTTKYDIEPQLPIYGKIKPPSCDSIGRAVGLDPHHVWRIFNADDPILPSLISAEKIAKHLGINISELVDHLRSIGKSRLQ